ncbi:MAG: hypothetical protein F4210_13920 [Holophagales bacterium]|nr:hypothetical protein [Holophagales bacterium]MYF96578.1 hypothetical protein [Holophagales bacterium]
MPLEHTDSPKLEGVFWLPENEVQKWPGVIQLLDYGVTRITIWQLGEHRHSFYGSSKTILGEVNSLDRRYVTAKDCYLRKGPSSIAAGPASTSKNVERLCIGGEVVIESQLSLLWHGNEAPSADDLVSAEDFWFILEGIEGWLGRKLWDIGDDGSYKAKKHPELTFRVDEGVHASMRVATQYDWRSPGLKVDTSGEVRMTSSKPLDVLLFGQFAEHIQKFMCFAWGRQCLIREMCIARDGQPAASVWCPTWLSGFPSGEVDKLFPSGTFFMARDVRPETKPELVLEKWCDLCAEAEDVVESIVRVLADSRSTDRRADLVVPALEKLSDSVAIEEPDWRKGDRDAMLAAVHPRRVPFWSNLLRRNSNPLKRRLDGLFATYIGDRIDAETRHRVVEELVKFRSRRFHKGFYEISDRAWYQAVAVLYFCVLDRLGVDWRPLVTDAGTLSEHYRQS